jgi:hypothetical protein
MDSIVSALRLGRDALLFKEHAYEEMREAANPVVKGLILIVIVGVVIALLGLVGTGLELASTPDLGQIRDIVYDGILKMPFWAEIPGALDYFDEWYNRGWDFFPRAFGAPTMGAAALDIVTTPLGLVLRWLLYGLVAYLFARWLGGSGGLTETLGVLALAVAPQALRVFELLPFVQMGSLISVWGVLCAYLGVKTVHKLSWARALWARLLPFILAFALLFLVGCISAVVVAAVVGGAS